MHNNTQRGFVIWILIIVGLILALTLMGFFAKNVERAYSPSGETTPEVVSSPTSLTPAPPVEPTVVCGLNITNPLPDATIQSPAVIQGYTNGCGWDVVGGGLATVQLFSSTDVPLTTAIPVSLIGPSGLDTTSFFTTLVYPDSTSVLSGYLFFVHSGTGLTQRVNVKY